LSKLLTGLAAGAAALAFAGPASAATVVVTPTDMDGWTAATSSCSAVAPTSSSAFVTGPGTPPAGTGSYQMQIGANGDSFETLTHAGLAGKKPTDLTALSYSTYVTSFGSGGQAAYLILRIDTNGDGVTDDMLFFEPVYQTGTYSGEPVPNQGAPVLNTWQTWNARVGGWWTLSSGTFGPPLTTLEKYGASNPTATILNLRVATGCGGAAWANFLGNADNVTVGVNGSTTYDFEPTAPPSPPTGRDKVNPAEACRAERARMGEAAFIAFWAPADHPTKRNAWGKCVSTMAKANRADNGLTVHRLAMSAAAECKAERSRDAALFRNRFGTAPNALGKCVAAKARTQVTKLSTTPNRGKGRGRKP
jgi:hypothetical protein